MSGSVGDADRPVRTFLLSLLLLGLAASLVAACGASSTPASLAGEPTATARPEVPTATARPPTPSPVPASPTVPKPTATFVPLITPSPTPTGDYPTQASVPRIGVAEARALADAGEAILVDVRSRATYEQEHIQGALSLPLDQVAQRLAELSGEAQIIFYCA